MPNMPQWVSVKDRLPEMSESYTGGGPKSVCVLIFNGRFVSEGRYEETFAKRRPVWKGFMGLSERAVTHWMPLPDPPSGEVQ